MSVKVNTLADALEDLDLLAKSETKVFFRYSLEDGSADKSPIMTAEAGKVFLTTFVDLGHSFRRIWVGRAEHF